MNHDLALSSRFLSPFPEQRRGLIIVTAIIALTIGAVSAALYDPGSIAKETHLLILLVGAAAIVGTVVVAYPPVPTLVVALVILPVSLRLLAHGDTAHLLMAGALAISGLALVGCLHLIGNIVGRQLEREQALGTKLRAVAAEKDAADQAVIAKSRFCAAASHDLSQPLHALGMFVGELQSRAKDADMREIVDKVNASVQALNGLFGALLDISKLDCGDIQPKVTDFPVKRLLRELRIEFQSQADEKNLQLKIRPSDAWLHTDSDLLGSVVRNYISNAVRYTRKGGILVGCRRRGDRLSIEVWDTGIGLDQEQLQRIFEPFYQVDNAERDRSRGVGLGLAVVERVAVLLDCEIDVASTPGKGSCFRVLAPLVARESAIDDRRSGRSRSVDSLAGTAVVLIDDESSILQGMSSVFEIWGCDVLAVTSAREALTRLIDWGKRPDVVIADYRLRDGRTGIQAIQELRLALNREIPAVVITGDSGAETFAALRASGIPYLHKPVRPDRLRAYLSVALEGDLPSND